MNEQEVKKLYNALVDKGYDKKDIGDEKTFAAKMSDAKNRKELYDYVSGRGDFRIGGFEDYEQRITRDAAAPQVMGLEGYEVKGEDSAAASGTPGIAPQQVKGYEALRDGARRFNKRMEQSLEDFKGNLENIREYGSRLNGGQTSESGIRYNPVNGKMEKTYVTPYGNRYSSKRIADLESFRYRQAADMTTGGQLRKAVARRDEISRRLAERSRELEKEFNGKSVLEKIAASMRHAEGGYQGTITGTTEDDEYMKLQAALHQSNEQIKTLQEQMDREGGADTGFWRGFARTVTDPYTWLQAPAMGEAVAMVNTHGGTSEADDLLLQSAYGRQQAETMYGGNAGFWYRAGVMTGYMPSFMLDFAATGGGFDAINVAGKASAKAATRAIGKEAVEKMAKQGFKTYVKNNGIKGFGREAANWTIKALGTTADDLLIRAPLMANTVQAGDTAADIIDQAGRRGCGRERQL